MNVDPNKLKEFTDAKNKIFLEDENHLLDFYNTVITLFVSLFSVLFFLGTTLNTITRLQSILLLFCLATFLIIVILAISGKFFKHIENNEIQKNLNIDMDEFLTSKNEILFAKKSKFTSTILEVLHLIIYFASVLDLVPFFF